MRGYRCPECDKVNSETIERCACGLATCHCRECLVTECIGCGEWETECRCDECAACGLWLAPTDRYGFCPECASKRERIAEVFLTDGIALDLRGFTDTQGKD